MTFEEFVTEWRRQVSEYGGGVPQEAVDMAEQAWEVASAQELEACAKLCEAIREGAWDRDGDKAKDECAAAIRMRGER